jgi:bifunctional DNA-binding transcriptional regulator/antitoxin component of YhaV-PrlF toxin-antitoxin module
MTITATQKIIKVGSSGAVTIPAKDMKRMGVSFGDELKLSFEPVKSKPDEHTLEVVGLTQKLIKRHDKALKNLSQR